MRLHGLPRRVRGPWRVPSTRRGHRVGRRCWRESSSWRCIPKDRTDIFPVGEDPHLFQIESVLSRRIGGRGVADRKQFCFGEWRSYRRNAESAHMWLNDSEATHNRHFFAERLPIHPHQDNYFRHSPTRSRSDLPSSHLEPILSTSRTCARPFRVPRTRSDKPRHRSSWTSHPLPK